MAIGCAPVPAPASQPLHWPLGITVNLVLGRLLRTTDTSADTPEPVFDPIAANTAWRVTPPQEAADATLLFASP